MMFQALTGSDSAPKNARGQQSAMAAAIGCLWLFSLVGCENPGKGQPGLGTEFVAAGENDQGFQRYTHTPTGIHFILLPSGEFLRGTKDEDIEFHRGAYRRFMEMEPSRSVEAGYRTETPRTNVHVKSFLIAETEVTQDQWKKVKKTNPSRFQGGDLPVDSVTWREAKDFCDRLGLLLPTENQWEYACAGGSETRYAWGDRLEAEDANFNGAHFGENDYVRPDQRTRPVRSFRVNSFGLFHMHGNVAEWCRDIWNPNAYRGGGLTFLWSSIRSYRGGSWFSIDWLSRTASRHRARDTDQNDWIGFRPVYEFETE